MQDTLWRSVLGEIELSVPQQHYDLFFKNSVLLSNNDGTLVIGVYNVFVQAQLQKKYDTLLRQVFERNGVPSPSIEYRMHATKKSIISRETTGTSEPLSSRADSLLAPAPHTPAAKGESRNPGTINPRYTLSNFIVGSSNDIAYAAAQAVAANPGTKYNPLFLYGGVGLGKTHLMQAVGNEIVRNKPGAKIVYVTMDAFTKEFTDAIRTKKQLSDRFRKADVLIVDDIQFISGREKTEEEFFHIFNALHQEDKQVIISSDKHPRSIASITDRLRSRFEMGMLIDIQMPDFETRCAIIQAKANQSGVTLEDNTVEYLASNLKTNIRELEGALNQLLAYCEMRGMAPDIDTAEGLLGDVRHARPKHVTAKQIIDKTARHFGIDSKDICSERRDKHIVVPRQIAMYLLRSELKMSYPLVARELGRKDHTTAMHSVEKIERAMKLDLMTREQVAEIRDRLYV